MTGVTDSGGSAGVDWSGRIGEVLPEYGVGPDAAVQLLSLSENAMFRVEDPAQEQVFVIRLHRPGFRSLEQIRSELSWLDALGDHDVLSVPAVIPTLDGETVCILPGNGESDEMFAVAFAFIRGEQPDDLRALEHFHTLGAMAARMHAFTLDWRPPAQFTRPVWDFARIIGDRQGSEYGDWRETPEVTPYSREVLETAEREIRRRLQTYSAGPSRWGLVHFDMRLSNLLIDGDRVALVDFDDCGESWLMSDLACALTFIEASPMAPALAQQWIGGYRSVRSLSDADVEIIPTLVMLRRLQMVAWMHRRDETATAASLRTTFVHGTVAIARNYLQDRYLSLDAAAA